MEDEDITIEIESEKCPTHGEHFVEEGCPDCEIIIEAARLIANDKAE